MVFYSLLFNMVSNPTKAVKEVGSYPILDKSGNIEGNKVLMSDGSSKIVKVELPKTKEKKPSRFQELMREKEKTRDAERNVTFARDKEKYSPNADDKTVKGNPEKLNAGNIESGKLNPIDATLENPGGAIGSIAGETIAKAAVPIPILGDLAAIPAKAVGNFLGTAVGDALIPAKSSSAEVRTAETALTMQQLEEKRIQQDALADMHDMGM